MEQVGEGYYYTVYALSPVRVVKKRMGYLSKAKKLLTWYKPLSLRLLGNVLWIPVSTRNALKRSAELARIPELRSLLGNPAFTARYEYTQDRVLPLGTVLETADDDSFLAYVEQYLEANLLLWEYGYGETVHNFTLNAGRSQAGAIVLFDFNELTRSKEAMRHDIETQKWMNQASMRGIAGLRPELHARIAALFGARLTYEALDARWGTKA